MALKVGNFVVAKDFYNWLLGVLAATYCGLFLSVPHKELDTNISTVFGMKKWF